MIVYDCTNTVHRNKVEKWLPGAEVGVGSWRRRVMIEWVQSVSLGK